VGDQGVFLILVLVACVGTLLSAYAASWALSLLTFITLVISVGAAISSLIMLCVLPLSLGLTVEYYGDITVAVIMFIGACRLWPSIFENGILDV
jgi:hypothetical protein